MPTLVTTRDDDQPRPASGQLLGAKASARSSLVTTDQTGPHPLLEKLVRNRHRARYARPVAAHSRVAFTRAEKILHAHGGPVILDSGCGTGVSSLLLARRYPRALIIGIDKSMHRLRRGEAMLCAQPQPNVSLLRANCVDVWRLAREAQWPVSDHFMMYPNPWPKHTQLTRRWHGHPVMPELLSLGGRLELRSNWPIYIKEFAATVKLLTGRESTITRLTIDTPLSPFERKYAASGHVLYRLTIDLAGHHAPGCSSSGSV